ncbi:MAG: Crp/Fnr family transcriptional regulator [Paramuribaculum sp.]|nr:Crp/Fnr family transcriptional regulator [Paramuribaculum sp.]MDE6587178.1 Crp/Fnr family transcriptional regulator [Paramuribaculum sp.]MDE7236333.1 Crp/Fnr family transcriptional regulator [Paramuribaculum sp.]
MIRAALEQVISEDMSEIWSVLSSDEKRRITDTITIHRFKKNQIIYAERDEPETLWCLFEGKAKMYKDGIGGRQQTLRLLRPVQYFGYRAYFAGEPYVHTAVTMEPSVIGALPMSVVSELIENNRQVAWFFIHELSRNLGSADIRTVNLTQKHIRGRLAESLIVLLESYGVEDDGMTLRVYMGREDLANLSNMTTSNAIRTLTSFVTEKVIIVDGRKIKIVDEVALRKISKFG